MYIKKHLLQHNISGEGESIQELLNKFRHKVWLIRARNPAGVIISLGRSSDLSPLQPLLRNIPMVNRCNVLEIYSSEYCFGISPNSLFTASKIY